MNLKNFMYLIFIFAFIKKIHGQCSGSTQVWNTLTELCISESDCSSSTQTLYLYNNICTNVECPSLPSQQAPGYKQSPQNNGNIKCSQCPIEMGIGGSKCRSCVNEQILDYNDGKCKSVEDIIEAYKDNQVGAWTFDKKSYLKFGKDCPHSLYNQDQEEDPIVCAYCSIGFDEDSKMCLESFDQCKLLFFNSYENLCSNTCPTRFQITNKSESSYSLCSLCPFYKPYVSVDRSECLSFCHDIEGQILLFKEFSCIKIEDCTKFLDINNLSCMDSCQSGQYYMSVQNVTYSQCYECPESTPFSSPDFTACLNKCSSEQITFENRCISSPDQCPYTLSKDGKTCLYSCSYGEIEKLINDSYNQCQVCPPETPFSNNSFDECLNSCQFGQIQLQNEYHCLNYCSYLSSDKKFCTKNCQPGYHFNYSLEIDKNLCIECPPDFPYTEGFTESYCVKECSEVEVLLNNEHKCVNKYKACSGDLNVLSSSNFCTDTCNSGEFMYQLYFDRINQKGHYECQECPLEYPISSQDQLECLDKCPEQQISKESKYQINSKEVSKERKECSFKGVQGEIRIELQNHKECPQCPEQHQQSAFSCVKQCNDEDIFDLKIIYEPILSNEGGDNDEKGTFDKLILTILSQNLQCESNNAECLQFPLIKIRKRNFQMSEKRVSSFFSVTFSVSEQSSKYVCLIYDLSSIGNILSWNVPVQSEDRLKLTCNEIQENVQILLDSDCKYISKSACSDDYELGIGEIFGIIIGFIVLGSLIVILIAYFLKRKSNRNPEKRKIVLNEVASNEQKQNQIRNTENMKTTLSEEDPFEKIHFSTAIND